MDKEIIKLPIGDIKNNYFLYELEMVKDGLTQKIKPSKKYKMVFFYLTLFLIIGLPLIILSPHKTFHFFYKKTGYDVLDPTIYDIDGKIIERFVFCLLFFLFCVLYPYICFFECVLPFRDNSVMKYNWTDLYNKLKNEGYQPEKNTYIRVIKYRNYYVCRDGNHRHKILESFYPKDTVVDVLFEGESFKH